MTEALEVLDVHRGVDVDPGVEQLLDVLEALGVSAPRRVRMSEAVDDDESRSACEDGVEVHLLERLPAVLETAAWDHFEPLEQPLSLAAVMRLDSTDHDVDILSLLLARGLQHG